MASEDDRARKPRRGPGLAPPWAGSTGAEKGNAGEARIQDIWVEIRAGARRSSNDASIAPKICH